MKKGLSFAALALGALLILPSTASAQSPTELKMTIKDMRADLEKKKEVLKEKVAQKIVNRMVQGKVTAINGTSLNLAKDSKTYTVDISSAKLVRRFGAKMLASEIQVNDELQVHGAVSSTTVTAKLVRNLSLQRRSGTFEGTVSNVTATSFTLTPNKRKAQIINLLATTKIMKNGTSTTMADLVNGAKVVVSGVWDRANSNVSAEKIRIMLQAKNLTGTLTGISGTMLTVLPKNSSSSVMVDVSAAHLARRHGSKAGLAELKAGDEVQIQGKLLSPASTIMATWVKDLSLTTTPKAAEIR